MIDPGVAALSLQFQRAVRSALGDNPHCCLDFTWPSIGLLDLLLFRLRNKTNYDENDLAFIRGAAAYLACLTHDCWSFFPGSPKVELTFKGEETFDVLLRASGGSFLAENEQVSLGVTEELTRLLQNPPRQYSFFGKFTRAILPDDNILSLFGLGLMTGYLPAISGRWPRMTLAEYSPQLSTASVFLAHGCALRYKNIFPHEPIGQEPALYLAGLVLPPAGYGETFPHLRTVSNLVEYFSKRSYSKEAQASLFFNLAASTDDHLRSVGFVMAIGSAGDHPPRRLISLATGFVGHAPSFLSPVANAREHFGAPRHWTALLRSGDIERARPLFEAERQLNMLPLAYPSSRYLTDRSFQPIFQPVFEALALGDPVVLRDVIQKIDDPLPRDLCCLEAVSCFALGEHEQAQNILRNVNDDGTCALANELLGESALYAGKLEEAEELLTRAYSAAEEDTFLKYRRGLHLVKCRARQGNTASAVELVEELLPKHGAPLTLLVQQHRLLKKQGSLDKARDVREQITNRGIVNRLTFPIFLQAGISEDPREGLVE